jgi:hypothetical protein
MNKDEANRTLRGSGWNSEHWWYKLAHVCRRWRILILTSTSHLGLSLLCTYGTPIEDMLAHSPPLPLIIEYFEDNRDITAKDETGIMFALRLRDRVHPIHLRMPFSRLQRLVVAIDEEFPILDYLYIGPSITDNSALNLPNTFQAPRLRRFLPRNFTFQLQSPLLTTAMGLVTLSLWQMHPAYVSPNDLLQRLSLLPQLEILGVGFHSLVPQRDIERQLLRLPVATQFTLQKIRQFGFEGTSTYLEALLPRMATPLLENLQVRFFHERNFSVPHFLEFMGRAENLKFGIAKFLFLPNALVVEVYPYVGTSKYVLRLEIRCIHLNWQVASAVQLLSALRTLFSTVVHLFLVFRRNLRSTERNDEVDRRQWRELLMTFGNVKTLGVYDDFGGQIPRSLQVGNGEPPLELLPELQKVEYNASRAGPDAFQAFFKARRKIGRPVKWSIVSPVS